VTVAHEGHMIGPRDGVGIARVARSLVGTCAGAGRARVGADVTRLRGVVAQLSRAPLSRPDVVVSVVVGGVGESCAQHARSRCATTTTRFLGSHRPRTVVRQDTAKSVRLSTRAGVGGLTPTAPPQRPTRPASTAGSGGIGT